MKILLPIYVLIFSFQFTSFASDSSPLYLQDLQNICAKVESESNGSTLNNTEEEDLEVTSSTCGGVIEGSSGMISFDWNNSSSKTQKGPGQQYCVWTIHSRSTDSLKFSMKSMELQKKDWISFTPLSALSQSYIYSRNIVQNSRIIRSNERHPEEFIMFGSVIFVIYSVAMRKGKTSAQNFQLQFESTDILGYENSEASMNIRNFFSSDPSGSFSHPSQESGFSSYQPNILITHVIANSMKKQLTLRKLNLTENLFCSDDFIERFIVNEDSPPGSLIAEGGQEGMKSTRYCGAQNVTGGLKMGDKLSPVNILIFRSYIRTSGKGFEFSWE